jgi:tellurite methyltransferase
VAIDLGSGNGRDSRHLLQQGWQVTAIEKEISGIEILKANLDPEYLKNLTVINSAFEDLQMLPPADLIYASASLPFCSQEFFPKLWQMMDQSLRPKALFAGQFFGPDDEWCQRDNPLLCHSKAAIEKLFAGYKIIALNEKNEKGPTAAGPLKHWHIFDVIAEKR